MMPMNMAMSVRPATLAGLRVYACSARRCSTQYWFHTSVGKDLRSRHAPCSAAGRLFLHGNDGKPLGRGCSDSIVESAKGPVGDPFAR